MPTIVGTLIFISKINFTLSSIQQEKNDKIMGILIFIRGMNFMPN